MARVHGLSNLSIKNKMRQIIIMLVLIFIGILVSNLVNAQSTFQKEKERHFKMRFKKQIAQSKKVCFLLDKKQSHNPKTPLLANVNLE